MAEAIKVVKFTDIDGKVYRVNANHIVSWFCADGITHIIADNGWSFSAKGDITKSIEKLMYDSKTVMVDSAMGSGNGV